MRQYRYNQHNEHDDDKVGKGEEKYEILTLSRRSCYLREITVVDACELAMHSPRSTLLGYSKSSEALPILDINILPSPILRAQLCKRQYYKITILYATAVPCCDSVCLRYCPQKRIQFSMLWSTV